MNDHIHPVMQQAINQTLRAALDSFDAPPCPRGQFAYTYRHPELGALDCHLEGEEGDESVGWPEQVTLCSAYLRGVDIADRLTVDEIDAIEISAAHQPVEQLEDV